VSIQAIIPPYITPELIRVQKRVRDDDTKLTKTIKMDLVVTPETKRMRSNLETINKTLLKHWYDLEISDEQLITLQKQLVKGRERKRPIRFDNRTVYRSFNSTDLTEGGRFYGGWWQNLPKDFRPFILINGKRTVELDYSNMHPTILYSQVGIPRPKDCYSNIIEPKKIGPNYNPTELRKIIKAAFNAMLNSTRKMEYPPRGLSFSKFGLKWKEISNAILEAHQPIADYFYTGVGLKLQRLDSDIAERVLVHFAVNSIPILPLHDSFRLHNGYNAELEEVMSHSFEKVIGIAPVVDIKTFKSIFSDVSTETDDPFGNPVTDDIYELLDSFQGHDRRLDAFRAMQG
jgi:hypothetical protein